SMKELGWYSLASNLASIVPNFSGGLTGGLLLPLYAEQGRHTTPELLRRLKKARTAMLLLTLPPLAVLVAFGGVLVHLIWDTRYGSAGWMMQILCAGHIMASMGNIGTIHYVREEPWVSAVLESAKAAVLFAGLGISYWLGGTLPLVLSIASASATSYPMAV